MLPGAKLCAACRSALKRARADPSSVLQPLVGRAGGTSPQRKSRKARRTDNGDGVTDGKAAIVIPPPVDSRRGVTPAIVGAIAAAICIIGYVILQHGDDGARADPSADAAVSTAVSTAVPTPATTPAAPAAAGVPGLAALPTIAVPVATELATLPHGAVKPKKAARRAPNVPAMTTLPIEVAAPAAQQLPSPVAIVTAAPPPDKRTRVRIAFAKCAVDNLLQQAFCEQRARNELCEGLWGTVPQCPAQRDYGN